MRTREGIRTGLIRDNPLRGLCERMCIEVKRVFDGCYTRVIDEILIAPVLVFSTTPVLPLRFLSATSLGQYTPISAVEIESIGDRGESRVSFDVSVPITAYFDDVNRTQVVATANLSYHLDIVMRVPRDSIMPFNVECYANVEATKGRIEGNNMVLTCCIMAVTRIVAPVDIIIPTYGLAEFDEADSASVCQTLFETPLFADLD